MRKKIFILSGVLLLIIAIMLIGVTRTTQNTEQVRVYIPNEASYNDVLDTLKAYNCMPNTMMFGMLSRIKSYPNHIKSGSYVIPTKCSLVTLFKKLYGGQQDPIKLTLLKYRTADQLCSYLSGKLQLSKEEMLQVMGGEEALVYFIPNTYEVYWTISPSKLMDRMKREWSKFWTKERMMQCEMLKMTPMEVMTLASIVDEETNQNSEKSLVASVYLNRLKKGMLLQADPTVKYAVGDFSLQRITSQHTSIDNPYNTYKYKGLPPSVICTPSIASIDAVLQNRQTNFLYFCAKEDFSGFHNFAATLQQHNLNAKRFHRELNKRGIK